MDRRKAMKITTGAFALGGVGLFTLTNVFKPEKKPDVLPQKLQFNPEENKWNFFTLDPVITAQLAYDYYNEGSCMFATIKSIISQLVKKIGEPYTSFPVNMFKYGHGGIGGYGSVCGALNGAAAIIGLLIPDKKVQDNMINDIFQWYEKESFPQFNPVNPKLDFTPSASISNSVLCHASNTNWSKASGYTVSSNERKERCRRLTADVAQKVAASLNEIFTNVYVPNSVSNDEATTCMACHGNEGKIKNTSVKMSCTSCHSESVGHHVFADVHYKFMKEQL